MAGLAWIPSCICIASLLISRIHSGLPVSDESHGPGCTVAELKMFVPPSPAGIIGRMAGKAPSPSTLSPAQSWICNRPMTCG